MRTGKSFISCICEICGDHIGMGFDHTECSKEKSEIYAGEKKAKRPAKLPKKSIEYLGDMYSGK